jgi:hypothetical protein
MPPASKKKTEEMGYILTGVCRHRDFPGLWGFEVFTSEWRQLARFTYKSEREAASSATSFAWIMRRIATVSLAPAFLST